MLLKQETKTESSKIMLHFDHSYQKSITHLSAMQINLMPMYNLLEYSDNYSVTSGRLWNYYRDEVNDDSNEDNAADIKISNKKTLTGKYFEYKAKSIGSMPNNNNNILDAEVVVPLKHFSNVWRSLDLPSINCKIELNLSWSKECIMSEI